MTVIDINPDASLDMVDLEINFLTSVSEELKKEIEDKISDWAQKGIKEGYGGGYIHYEGRHSWSRNSDWLRVSLDMGSADEEEDVSFNELEKILLPYPVKQIKIGYDYPEDRYEQDEETKKLLEELQDLDKSS